MSRPSQAALATVTPLKTSPLRAPADLTPNQVQIWAEVVDSMPAKHFSPADTSLLRTFVQVTEQLRHAQAKIGQRAVIGRGAKSKLSPWFAVIDKSIRQQTMLARALRISLQSRIDPIPAGRRTREAQSIGDPRPWEGEP